MVWLTSIQVQTITHHKNDTQRERPSLCIPSEICMWLLAPTPPPLAPHHSDVRPLPHTMTLMPPSPPMATPQTLPAAVASRSLPAFDSVAERMRSDTATHPRMIDWLWSNAMRVVIKNDDLAMVQRIHELHPEPLGVHSVGMAVRNGSIDLVQWVVANRRDRMCRSEAGNENLCQGCFKDYVMRMRRSGSRSAAACLEVGAWCHERGLFNCLEEGPDYPFKLRCLPDGIEKMLLMIQSDVRDEKSSPFAVFSDAMDKNDVDTVRFILEGGHIEFDEDSDHFVAKASIQGNTQVVEYIMSSSFADPFRHKLEHKSGYLLPFKTENEDLVWLMRVAVSIGNLEAMQCIHRERGVAPQGPVTDTSKTEDEIVAIYEWMASVGVETFDCMAMHYAVNNYWPKVVEWLCDHDAQRFCYTSPQQAAERGHLQTLQLIHDWDLQPIDDTVMTYAAMDGHLEVVQWLTTILPYDGMWTHALACAVAFNRIEIATWVLENGEDVCADCAIKIAVSLALRMWDYTCCDGLRWLYDLAESRCEDDCVGQIDRYSDDIRNLSVDDAIAMYASTAGDLPLIQWLAQQTDRDTVDWNRAAESAATFGHLGVIQWIHRQEITLDWERVRAAAVDGRRVEQDDYNDPAWERGIVETEHIDAWIDVVTTK